MRFPSSTFAVAPRRYVRGEWPEPHGTALEGGSTRLPPLASTATPLIRVVTTRHLEEGRRMARFLRVSLVVAMISAVPRLSHRLMRHRGRTSMDSRPTPRSGPESQEAPLHESHPVTPTVEVTQMASPPLEGATMRDLVSTQVPARASSVEARLTSSSARGRTGEALARSSRPAATRPALRST